MKSRNIYNLLIAFIFLIIGFLFPSNNLNAQQFPHKNLFTETSFVWNPAMTASWNFMEVGALHSEKWSAFEDAPVTSAAYGQFPLVYQNMSVGGYIMNDVAGGLTQNRITLTYAYHFELGIFADDRLSLGLGVSLNRYFLNGDLTVSNFNDPLLFNREIVASSPNISAGFFYRTTSLDGYDSDSHFFIGLSTYQTLPRQLTFDANLAKLEQNIHANLVTGARLVQDNGFIEPTVWVDYAMPNQYRVTLNLRYELYDAFWAGIGVGSDLTTGLQGGIILTPDFLQDGSLRIGGTMNLNGGRLSQFKGIGYDFYLAYRYEL